MSTWIPESPYNIHYLKMSPEKYEEMQIRYRTLGCMTITITGGNDYQMPIPWTRLLQEVAAAKRQTERGNRSR